MEVAPKARRGQLLSTQLAPFHDPLCEVVMNRRDVSLLRGLRYGVVLAAAAWPCESQHSWLISAQELSDLRGGHRAYRGAHPAAKAFSSDELSQFANMNARYLAHGRK